MKTLMLAWLMVGGHTIQESIVLSEFPTLAACVAKGEEVKAYFDGVKTLTTADYVCEVVGEDA